MLIDTVESFVGVGAGTRLYRVTGTVAGHRRPIHWKIIIKVLTLDELSFQSISTDQSSWDYWKREWHVYQSPWQQQLTGPLVAPRCLATGDLLAESDEELAWIAMEDLESMDHRPWRHGRFRERSHGASASLMANIWLVDHYRPSSGSAETGYAAGPKKLSRLWMCFPLSPALQSLARSSLRT